MDERYNKQGASEASPHTIHRYSRGRAKRASLLVIIILLLLWAPLEIYTHNTGIHLHRIGKERGFFTPSLWKLLDKHHTDSEQCNVYMTDHTIGHTGNLR